MLLCVRCGLLGVVRPCLLPQKTKFSSEAIALSAPTHFPALKRVTRDDFGSVSGVQRMCRCMSREREALVEKVFATSSQGYGLKDDVHENKP